jgi:hypothetical protein
MAKIRHRQSTKLVNLPKHLMRPDLERRGPLRLEKFLDLTGRKYERCSVIGLAGFIRGYSVWLCRCNCGTQFLARANKLQRERVGCGCGGGKIDRHGDSHTVEYARWNSMNTRYRKEVCPRWRSYRNFLADVGRRPGPDYEFSRINKRKPFGPGNAGWVPKLEAMSRRRSLYITYKGRTLNISDWAHCLGISHQAMNMRVQRCKRYGAPLSEALTTLPGEYMPTAFEQLKRPKRTSLRPH